MLRRSIIILVVLVLLVAGGYYGWGRLQEVAKIDPPQMVAVKRDTFTHEILARGNVDSAQNQEVRVRVEMAGEGGLTIVYVIEEGTLVKKGDLLVELESSWLSERTERQQNVVIASESNLIRARADLETAELTLTEYLDGKFKQDEMTIENRIFTAEEQVRTQSDNLAHSQRLFDRGYITKAQVDAAIFELERALQTKVQAELDLRVLNEFTKERMLTQYKADIEIAKNGVEAAEKMLEIDTNRLAHLQRQLANTSIYAPSDGQVVYFMPRWGGDENLIREGKRVIDKEILLLLPDPTQMRVRGLINEANVRFVRPGQRATIRLEAFLNETFEGEVTNVNSFPEPSSWQGGAMSREYLTTVKILDTPEGVRTGLTAEARIVVDEVQNARLLPKQAVFTYRGKTYAITFNAGQWGKVEVITGPANDREVVILEGLNEGDEVVLGAWVHRDKVDIPQEEPEEERENEEPENMEMQEMPRDQPRGPRRQES